MSTKETSFDQPPLQTKSEGKAYRANFSAQFLRSVMQDKGTRENWFISYASFHPNYQPSDAELEVEKSIVENAYAKVNWERLLEALDRAENARVKRSELAQTVIEHAQHVTWIKLTQGCAQIVAQWQEKHAAGIVKELDFIHRLRHAKDILVDRHELELEAATKSASKVCRDAEMQQLDSSDAAFDQAFSGLSSGEAALLTEWLKAEEVHYPGDELVDQIIAHRASEPS